MLLLPIRTPVIHAGDNLASMLRASAALQDGDILVVSSKAIATTENAAIDLTQVHASDEAIIWSAHTGRSPAFMQAVLDETTRLNGRITGHCQGALLTELRPTGMQRGTIFAPNAGLDESNIAADHAIGWPHDPVESGKHLQEALNTSCAVIISDSCVRPRRIGVTAFALTCAGIEPIRSDIGKPDLFERPLKITTEAVADQLATAANILMGNAAQSIPAVIIRDHGFPITDFCGWVDGMEPERDLFGRTLGVEKD